MEALDGLLHDAVPATAAIALPMLAIAALVGTAAAVVQTATQAQRTLALLPKTFAIGAVMAPKR
jgi:flagellar biosynthesis protein FliQ